MRRPRTPTAGERVYCAAAQHGAFDGPRATT
jgi:hypothetical protein